MKLTSFEKLMERTCSSIRSVSFHCDADLKLSGGAGTSGMAPDAAYAFSPSHTWLLLIELIILMSLYHAFMIQ